MSCRAFFFWYPTTDLWLSCFSSDDWWLFGPPIYFDGGKSQTFCIMYDLVPGNNDIIWRTADHHHRATNIYYLVFVHVYIYHTQYITVTYVYQYYCVQQLSQQCHQCSCGWYTVLESYMLTVINSSIVWHYMSDYKTVLLWNFHTRYINNISFRRKVLLLFFWLQKYSKIKKNEGFSDWISTFWIDRHVPTVFPHGVLLIY